MRKLSLLLLAAVALSGCVGSAFAGEPNAIGCIYVADGGSSNNATSGYGYTAAGGAAAFSLGSQQLITLQCMVGPCHVATGVNTTDAGVGLYLASLEKITSSLGAPVPNVPLPDAGFYRGGLVSIAQAAGAASARVCVWQRTGNE